MANVVKIDDTNIISIIHGGQAGLPRPFAQDIYLVEVDIAGTSYVVNIEALEPQLTEGMRLNFFREPNNPYDSMAIVIKDSLGNKLGYVPRARNDILSRLMDAGKLLYGTVNSKEKFGDWLKVTVQVYLCD